MSAIQAPGNRSGNNPTKGTGEHGCGIEQRESLCLLGLLVPRGQEQADTGSKTSLKHTQNETNRKQSFMAFDGCHAAGHCSPENHDSGKVYRRTSP